MDTFRFSFFFKSPSIFTLIYDLQYYFLFSKSYVYAESTLWGGKEADEQYTGRKQILLHAHTKALDELSWRRDVSDPNQLILG